MKSLRERLQNGENILLDGGTGTELERRGVPMIDNAWCATGALTDPGIVREVHRSYIDAGAEVIIANTYATSRHLLAWAGIEDRFEEVNRAGVELARAARDEAGRPDVTVAASISTSQQGGEFPPIEVARANYLAQGEILANAGAELLILEMMRDIDQTSAALDGALATGLPVWVGFSCVIDKGVPLLFNQEVTLAEGLDALAGSAVELVAIMHSETEDIDACLDVLDEHWDGPVGIYAHCGVFEPPHWRFTNMITPQDYGVACRRWADRGVQVIGGCCGIDPEHISHLQTIL